jgi:4-amino-4-deoxy-L-arabinose transferase-like glycosyltransferase
MGSGIPKPEPELLAIALGAIAVSFALMFTGLGGRPFWVDEAIAVLPARSILTEGVPRNPFDLNFMAFQLEDGLWDPSAPLYRYSVAAVAAVFGFSETSTRGWSVALGLVMLAPIYLLFRRLFGGPSALLAVAFVAASPPFADLAREARHFTFVACMMAFTFYFLVDAAATGRERSRALWPVFLVATLLGHAMGYIALPIVGVFLLLSWRQPLLSRRHLWLYGGVLALYAGIQAKYGNTLPFLHSIGCENHIAGCHPEWYYYLGTLANFATGSPLEIAPGTLIPSPLVGLSNLFLPTVLVLIGVGATVAGLRGEREARAGRVLVLAWFLLPILLLSLSEAKFPRYLVYVLPPMCLFLAHGLVTLGRAPRLARVRRPLLATLAVVLILIPQLYDERVAGGGRRVRFRSRFLSHAFESSLSGETDNWEHIRAQTSYLQARLTDADVVVTSLDDASLGYYLGRFVYGFLNSQHDDNFFVGLLREASRRGGRVWFIDTLPIHNYCQNKADDPQGVDCRVKYRRFYEACRPESRLFNPACVRVRFD